MTGVLESYLGQQKEEYSGTTGFDGPWLVGNKPTFADTGFVTYHTILAFLLDDKDFNMENYPIVKDWLARLSARPAVRAALDAMMAEAAKNSAATT